MRAITVNEGVNNPSMIAIIKKILLDMGFKVISKETTAGTWKTWYDKKIRQQAIPINDIHERLTDVGIECTHDVDYDNSHYIEGNSFKIERPAFPAEEGYNLLLIQYRKNSAGKEYRTGLDV